MSTYSFPNKVGVFISAMSNEPRVSWSTAAAGFAAMDATGKSVSVIGKINLEGGPGSSKTISSSGGKIHIGAVSAGFTFANAGTTVRIGVQDTGATGLEDGSFDVYADWVGGTDTFTTNQMITFPMESGTKTINHGDLIAVSIEMISRAGADSVTFVGESGNTFLFPYCTLDNGSGPAKLALTQYILNVGLEFDDGTIGWFANVYPGWSFNAPSINTGTTPDEKALVFTAPFNGKITSLSVKMSGIASADTFSYVVYEDPLGSPNPISTTVVNPNFVSASTASIINITLTTEVNMVKDEVYAIALKPTSANSVSVGHCEFNTGNEKLLRATQLGETWYMGTRTDGGSTPFAPTTTTLPCIGFFVTDINTGGGGSYSFGG